MAKKQKQELRKVSLLDLSKASFEIIDKMNKQAEANEGEIDEVLALRFEENEELFFEKGMKAAWVALQLKNEAAMLKERMAEIKAREASIKKAESRLKNYLKMCMEATGREVLNGDLMKVSVQGQAIWPEVVDENVLPDEFKTGTLTIKGPAHILKSFIDAQGVFVTKFSDGQLKQSDSYKPDLKAIRKSFSEKKPVPGCVMPEKSTRLVIK